jgi:tRNA threonylcarbamoyladenosine biosynthesis protein TsaB
LTLAFDCSTQSCSAAVLADDTVLAWRCAAMERGQSEALMPMIVETLADADVGWGDLGLLAVTVGPGTFTGIRIGLAAARGIALAGGLPIAGVGTLEALAWGVPDGERRGRTLLVSVDSKRVDLFCQAFGPDLAALGAPFAAPAPRALDGLPGPVLLAGGAAHLVAKAHPQAILADAATLPDARAVARLATARFAAGRALAAQPLYLRPPDVTLPEACLPGDGRP